MMETRTQQKLGMPLDQLLRDHEVIERALILLDQVVERVEHGQSFDQAGVDWLKTFFVEFVDRYHHAKEEHGLFPMLEVIGLSREGGPIGVMLEEHAQGRQYLQAMADPLNSGGKLASLLRGYAEFLRAHMFKENTVLFVIADNQLDDTGRQELSHTFEVLKQQTLGQARYQQFLKELEGFEAGLA